jgi:pyruvate-ferredoxin/flavodoxin oxidoreductase
MSSVDENPFRLDSPRPTVPFRDYARNEIRFTSLARSRPAEAEQVMARAQTAATAKYRQYEILAAPHAGPAPAASTIAVAPTEKA